MNKDMANKNQDTGFFDDPARIAAALSTCASRLEETATETKSGDISCRSAVLQSLTLLLTAAASLIPGVTSQEIMVKIIPGFVPPGQSNDCPPVAPPAPSHLPINSSSCWSFMVAPYCQGCIWHDGCLNDDNVNQLFAEGSDAMTLYNLRRKQDGKNISAPLVVPGQLTPSEPTTGQRWLIPDASKIRAERARLHGSLQKQLSPHMEFLTFIGKVKGSNHWKATIEGRDNRRQYQGWRVLPCGIPVVVPVNTAAVEVPVATMSIVVPVVAPSVGMQAPVADPRFPPAKRQCRGLGNEELNEDDMQERNERDHNLALRLGVMEANLAAPVLRLASPRPVVPAEEASAPIPPAPKARQAARLVTEKRATEAEAARSAVEKQTAEGERRAAEDAGAALDSDDSDNSEEEDSPEDERDMPYEPELADGYSLNLNLLTRTTESTAFCENVLNVDDLMNWDGYDND